jgi:hypothetical protein
MGIFVGLLVSGIISGLLFSSSFLGSDVFFFSTSSVVICLWVTVTRVCR